MTSNRPRIRQDGRVPARSGAFRRIAFAGTASIVGVSIAFVRMPLVEVRERKMNSRVRAILGCLQAFRSQKGSVLGKEYAPALFVELTASFASALPYSGYNAEFFRLLDLYNREL